MCDNAKMDFTEDESSIRGISEDREDHPLLSEEKTKKLTLLQYKKKKKLKEKERIKREVLALQINQFKEQVAQRLSQTQSNAGIPQKSEIAGDVNKVYSVPSESKNTLVDVSMVPVPPESKSSTTEPFRIRVDNRNTFVPNTSTSTEILRAIINPEEIIVRRRKDEGTKPIFDREEVKLFDQIQREREHEIYQQKQIFVYELKKLVKLLFPEEHSGMSSYRSRRRRRSRSESKILYAEDPNKQYSPESPTSSKSSVTSGKAEIVNGIKEEPVETVESEIIALEDNGEVEGDALKPEGSTSAKQKEKKDKSGESKADPEELNLLDEWQKEIDARRQACLLKAERSRRRSRSRSRSRSPYYRNHSFMAEYVSREDFYREYERRHERDRYLEMRERMRSRELRASEISHYLEPIPPYYDMSARMMPMRNPSIRSPLPGGPRLPFPPRFMHPGMSRPYMFHPGI